MSRQSDFTDALLDPARAHPDGLTDPEGRPAGKRFDVYRNNVAASLTAALETAFPTVRKLVGEEFFAAMAGVYLRAHPPRSRLLMFYGAEMPAFLAGFEPVAHLGYLPDVARLDLAMRESYHAADTAPIAPDALGALPPARLMRARLTLAPSLRLIRSRWPLHGIWRANTEPGAPAPVQRAEDVLVLRPSFDPAPALLGPGEAIFVETLRTGAPFADAIDAATAAADRFDLTAALGRLLAGSVITAIETEDED